MTRLECAENLLWNFRMLDICNKEDVKALAYAIMELGKSELREEIKERNEEPSRYVANFSIIMEPTGAPVCEGT